VRPASSPSWTDDVRHHAAVTAGSAAGTRPSAAGSWPTASGPVSTTTSRTSRCTATCTRRSSAGRRPVSGLLDVDTAGPGRVRTTSPACSGTPTCWRCRSPPRGTTSRSCSAGSLRSRTRETRRTCAHAPRAW
jgi:hypothetical protein